MDSEHDRHKYKHVDSTTKLEGGSELRIEGRSGHLKALFSVDMITAYSWAAMAAPHRFSEGRESTHEELSNLNEVLNIFV